MESFYVGIGLPDPVEGEKEVFIKDDEDLIKDSIITILLTKIGQRLFVPDFGSRIWDYVFEQNDTVTINLVREVISQAIRAWEPRVDILEITAEIDENSLYLHLKLLIKRINRILDLPIDLSRDRLQSVVIR